MSLLTFKIDNRTRDVIDWMSMVKKARVPSPDELTTTLKNIANTAHYRNCKLNEELIRVLGFSIVTP
jgi:hypothetical protein